MTELSGRCLCGNITFSGDTEILRAGNCHCMDYRTATSAAYATLITVAEDAITIAGTPKVYRHKAESGADIEKLFYPDCGSQLFGRNSNRPGMLSLRAGVLEQTSEVKPAFNVFLDSKIESTPLDSNIPAFPRMPT